MKWLSSIPCLLLSACCLRAADPSILLARTHTDPSRMSGKFGVMDWPFATGFMRGGETAFTAVCWLRFRQMENVRVNAFCSQWSLEAARATREGGAALPPILDMTSASGTRGWQFSNPQYACPEILADQWGYGCYAVNVETPTALTITLAGTEKQVEASVGEVQAFNIQGTAEDYTLAVSPANPSAVYHIGFAVNPLVRFYGIMSQPDSAGFAKTEYLGSPLVPSISNEWTMCVAQGRVVGSKVIDRLVAFTWYGESFPPGETTNDASRATFAKDARVSFYSAHFCGTDAPRDIWGFKIFDRWLTDDQLRNVRDLDKFEMCRRGMTRFKEVR